MSGGKCAHMQPFAATKTVLFYSHWSMGENRNQLSIPCPVDRLHRRCGAMQCSPSCELQMQRGLGTRVSLQLLKLPRGISDLRCHMAPCKCGEGLQICQILLMVKTGATHGSIPLGRNFFERERADFISEGSARPSCGNVLCPKHKVALSEYTLMSRLQVHANKTKIFPFLHNFGSEPVPYAGYPAERFPSLLSSPG